MTSPAEPRTHHRMVGTQRRRRGELRALYRTGGIAAIVAVGVALVQVAIEVIGVGIMAIPVPDDVEGWYALARDQRILAVVELTTLQILIFGLVIPTLLAIAVALHRSNRTYVTVATAAGLIGVGVYLASNSALAVLSLADQYAAAATASERAAVVAAGRAAMATYEGQGLHAGSGLLMVAVAVLSAVMLRSTCFGRTTATAGLAAAVLSSGYYVAVALREVRFILLELGAALLMVWLAMVGYRLLIKGGVVRRHARRPPSQV